MKALKNINSDCVISFISSKIDSNTRKFLFYVYDYRQYRNIRDEEYANLMEIRNQKYLSDDLEIQDNIRQYVLQDNWDLKVLYSYFRLMDINRNSRK